MGRKSHTWAPLKQLSSCTKLLRFNTFISVPFLHYHFISGTHFAIASIRGIFYSTGTIVTYVHIVQSLHCQIITISQKISFELNAKTLAPSFTIILSHCHFIIGTWNRVEIFLLSATQKEFRIQLSWNYLLLDKKSQNSMQILYEKDFQINKRSFCICTYSLFVHCLACLRAKKTIFIYLFIHLIRPCDCLSTYFSWYTTVYYIPMHRLYGISVAGTPYTQYFIVNVFIVIWLTHCHSSKSEKFKYMQRGGE